MFINPTCYQGIISKIETNQSETMEIRLVAIIGIKNMKKIIM